jgi:hypothetical protein
MNKILFWILIILAILVVGVVGYSILIEKTMIVKKPAIYLYPEESSNINVQLNINGKIINDIPEYNNGWNVFVTKEGLIDNKYDYLFYEAKLNKISFPEEGWIIEYNSLEGWFDEKLPILGLNEKEISQFKEYWLNSLPEADYYEIKLLDKEFLKENMNLLITPTPDTIIRLEFYFKPISKKISINEPIVITPKRTGFTVVEWGGILG